MSVTTTVEATSGHNQQVTSRLLEIQERDLQGCVLTAMAQIAADRRPDRELEPAEDYLSRMEQKFSRFLIRGTLDVDHRHMESALTGIAADLGIKAARVTITNEGRVVFRHCFGGSLIPVTASPSPRQPIEIARLPLPVLYVSHQYLADTTHTAARLDNDPQSQTNQIAAEYTRRGHHPILAVEFSPDNI